MRDHPPIPITDLADNIERLKAKDGLKFSQEYEVRRILTQACLTLGPACALHRHELTCCQSYTDHGDSESGDSAQAAQTLLCWALRMLASLWP